MKRKEITSTNMIISNWKKIFGPWFMHKYFNVFMVIQAQDGVHSVQASFAIEPRWFAGSVWQLHDNVNASTGGTTRINCNWVYNNIVYLVLQFINVAGATCDASLIAVFIRLCSELTGLNIQLKFSSVLLEAPTLLFRQTQLWMAQYYFIWHDLTMMSTLWNIYQKFFILL